MSSRKAKKESHLQKVRELYEGCNKCDLYKRACQYVFFRGDSPCDVLFIGEAPGMSEDATGKPFIGRSGEVLEELIEETIDLTSNFTYGITNIVCCIPLNDDRKIRQPTKEEARACSERLLYTIRACKPAVIVPVGKIAEKHLPLRELPEGSVVCPIQHPAFILRKGGTGTVEYQKNLITMVELIESLQEANHAQKKQKRKKEKKSKAAMET